MNTKHIRQIFETINDNFLKKIIHLLKFDSCETLSAGSGLSRLGPRFFSVTPTMRSNVCSDLFRVRQNPLEAGRSGKTGAFSADPFPIDAFSESSIHVWYLATNSQDSRSRNSAISRDHSSCGLCAKLLIAC